MDLRADALKLDKEASELAGRLQSQFVAIGRIMFQMCELDKWKTLTDARTGAAYTSLESWVNCRFRSQRATAFAARTLYRQLHPNIPDYILEASEPGALKVLAQLPASAQRSPDVQKLLISSTTGEFAKEALRLYPEELVEKRVRWVLNPTLSQAAVYDRVIAIVQRAYGDIGTVLSREDGLEALLADYESENEAVETGAKA